MAGSGMEIAALGVIILAGVVGRLFLKKTGVSDVFLLILFGAVAGVFVPQGAMDAIGGFLLPLGAVTLLMIILDEGLRLSFGNLFSHAHKALLFGAVSFALAFSITFAASYFAAGFPLLVSLAIAAIFASVAPEMLSGFLSASDSSDGAKAMGEIEATVSDALSVIAALLIADAALRGALSGAASAVPSMPSSSLQFVPGDIAIILFLSLACGSIAAAIWKAILLRMAEGNEHLLAIAVAAILYVAAGAIGASGVVAVFVFGIFLGNLKHQSITDVRKFQSEISFFLRTFFFVYLGALLFHSPKPIEVALLALAISVLLALARMISGRVAHALEPSSRKGRLLESVSSRGLTSAVLAIVVSEKFASARTPLPIDLPLLALFVIFFTNAISAWLVFWKKGK